jgi:hypothetical protein
VKPREYKKRALSGGREDPRSSKISRIVETFIDRTRGNISRMKAVKSSMETGRDIADRFTMYKWFLDVVTIEVTGLERALARAEEKLHDSSSV